MNRALRKVVEQIQQAGGLTDGQLLARFVADRDEASFTALLRRHGPMVLGVCRRVLRDTHDAEDAFQAAFLILARRAASVLKREAVGGYLYAVAYHTALEAAKANARRRASSSAKLRRASTCCHVRPGSRSDDRICVDSVALILWPPAMPDVAAASPCPGWRRSR